MDCNERLGFVFLLACALGACATDGTDSTDRSKGADGASEGTTGGDGTNGVAGSGADFGNTGNTVASAPPKMVELPGEGGNCGATSIAAEEIVIEEEVIVEEEIETVQPVAINIMLDKSGSMNGLFGFGALWPGAIDSIKQFVNDPRSAGIDVALQYFPVSGGQCDGTGYDTPAVPMGPLPANAANIIASLDANGPNGGTPMEGALRGATGYCESLMASNPDEKCVVVLITDGAPSGCDENHANLANIAGTAFGNGVITYGVGLEGSVFTLLDQISMLGGAADCDPNAPTYACDVTAGSDLLVETLMQIRDTVTTVVTHTETVSKTVETPLDCEFQLPSPDNAAQGFDPDQVNVQLTATGVDAKTFGKVASKADCVADAWYYDDAGAPSRIIACPKACDVIQATTGATVDILLGCPTVVIE